MGACAGWNPSEAGQLAVCDRPVPQRIPMGSNQSFVPPCPIAAGELGWVMLKRWTPASTGQGDIVRLYREVAAIPPWPQRRPASLEIPRSPRTLDLCPYDETSVKIAIAGGVGTSFRWTSGLQALRRQADRKTSGSAFSHGQDMRSSVPDLA